MLNKEMKDTLLETLSVCELHHKRLQFALNTLSPLFPLNISAYNNLKPEQISFLDQMVFRYSKLQDAMGNKLFRVILTALGEDIINVPFIDILNKLEKIGLIDDKDQWLQLRETRNLVSHEYPLNQQEFIDGLNELKEQCFIISDIWKSMKAFSLDRFNLTFDG